RSARRPRRFGHRVGSAISERPAPSIETAGVFVDPAAGKRIGRQDQRSGAGGRTRESEAFGSGGKRAHLVASARVRAGARVAAAESPRTNDADSRARTG